MKILESDDKNFILQRLTKDDNLINLAQKFNVDICNIIRNNPNIDCYEGEVVKIVLSKVKYHIVKPMQTLEDIAQIYNTTAQNLMLCNKLISKRIFIGQTLKIL